VVRERGLESDVQRAAPPWRALLQYDHLPLAPANQAARSNNVQKILAICSGAQRGEPTYPADGRWLPAGLARSLPVLIG
jgi:hypothetical protein